MKRISGLLIVLILLTSSIHANAQTGKYTQKFNFGISAGLNYNMHSPSFDYLQYDFSENRNSAGLHFGVIGNYPINKDFIFSGRLIYNDCSGELEGLGQTGGTHELINASLAYLEITPSVQFHNLLPVEPLYLLGGIELGFPVSNEMDILTNTSDIPDAATRLAFVLGAGYVFPISGSAYLTPEISFRLPVTDVSSNDIFDSWSVPQIRFGVNLTFDLSPDKEIPERHSELNAGFKEIRYYDKIGNQFPLEKVKVEETQYTELFPLVSYVFFEENKEQPSPEGQQLAEGSEAGEFSTNNLTPDALKINTRTLDIIGFRMTEYPNSRLSVKGTYDNKNEKDNLKLANARAEFVKNYLVGNYSIAENRITVEEGGLPEKPSSSKVEDGLAENRRIEIKSNDERVLAPIIIKGESKSIAVPNLLEFVPYATSTDSITYWKLEINRSDNTLRTFEGSGEPQPVKWIIYPNELGNNEIPLDYYLHVENDFGLEANENGSIPVEYYSFVRKKEEKLPDKTVSKFSLILFDFDNADVSEADMKIIDKNVLPAIKFNSTVRIYGYTDRIGNEDYNKKLALRRAEAVKKVLMEKANLTDDKIEVFGVGYNEGLFDNDLPLGRHLSRTVQVFVITPKE